jgi:hypothetical protein
MVMVVPMQEDVGIITRTVDLQEASKSLATNAMSLKHVLALPTQSYLEVIELPLQTILW